MKTKIKDGSLFVETRIYQAGNGAVFLDWANSVIKLSRDHSDRVAYDIPDFDVESWNNYYNEKVEPDTNDPSQFPAEGNDLI